MQPKVERYYLWEEDIQTFANKVNTLCKMVSREKCETPGFMHRSRGFNQNQSSKSFSYLNQTQFGWDVSWGVPFQNISVYLIFLPSIIEEHHY